MQTARHRVGLGQRVLARAAGTSQSAVAAIESGRRLPAVATLDRSLRATGSELVPTDPAQAALPRRSRRLSAPNPCCGLSRPASRFPPAPWR